MELSKVTIDDNLNLDLLSWNMVKYITKYNPGKFTLLKESDGIVYIKYPNTNMYVYVQDKRFQVSRNTRYRIPIFDLYIWKSIESWDQNVVKVARDLRNYVLKRFESFVERGFNVIGIGGEYFLYFSKLDYNHFYGITNMLSIKNDADFNMNIYNRGKYSNRMINYMNIKSYPDIDVNKSYDVIINLSTIYQEVINYLHKININNLIIITCDAKKNVTRLGILVARLKLKSIETFYSGTCVRVYYFTKKID
jgi:hypothetical protein